MRACFSFAFARFMLARLRVAFECFPLACFAFMYRFFAAFRQRCCFLVGFGLASTTGTTAPTASSAISRTSQRFIAPGRGARTTTRWG